MVGKAGKQVERERATGIYERVESRREKKGKCKLGNTALFVSEILSALCACVAPRRQN